jgi:hypothetical protein
MTATADEIVLALEPTTIAEWDVRDLVCGDRSAGLAFATREETAHLLDRVVLSLPRLSPIRNLAGYAAEHGVPLRQPAAADCERFDFHLLELPVSISVPAGRKLTRLRLGLDAEAVGSEDQVVAYDVFPAEAGQPAAGDGAAVSVDVSDMLTFASPAAAGMLGLNLTAPAWPPGRQAAVRCAQRLANPVAWDIGGEALGERFTAYVIWRAPKRVPLKVSASLLGELHGARAPEEADQAPGTGHGRLRKAQFRSASQYYAIPS